MPAIHLIKVDSGDCTFNRHGSGRVTMVDVREGNISQEQVALKVALEENAPHGRHHRESERGLR